MDVLKAVNHFKITFDINYFMEMLQMIEEIHKLVSEIHERGSIKDRFVWRRNLLEDSIPFLSNDKEIKEAVDAGFLTPLQQRNQVYLRTQVEDYINHKIKEIGVNRTNQGDPKGARKSVAGQKKERVLDTLKG